ncbi:hypothetical protein DPEC_G00021100 [Dallia pectoralis]|uniref:Uncharacterized protein n=1 Tax=Dallia pectoralis TaxID=75939 RepID=A0ACC2HGS0_DALPE|nr:hypothetical protein DPEC_G00021100 [Dallia pectoralis]
MLLAGSGGRDGGIRRDKEEEDDLYNRCILECLLGTLHFRQLWRAVFSTSRSGSSKREPRSYQGDPQDEVRSPPKD